MTAAELNLHVNTGLKGVNSAPKAFRRARCVRLFIIMGESVTSPGGECCCCSRVHALRLHLMTRKKVVVATSHYLPICVCAAFVYSEQEIKFWVSRRVICCCRCEYQNVPAPRTKRASDNPRNALDFHSCSNSIIVTAVCGVLHWYFGFTFFHALQADLKRDSHKFNLFRKSLGF